MRPIAEKHGFRIIDIEEHPDLALEYGIQQVPTFVADGRVVSGAMPEAMLLRKLGLEW